MTTNFDTEQTYGDLTSVLMFAFEQMMKGIDTCLPGIVESYDASTRRARVKPALRLLSTEGLSIEQASIVNVPVVSPAFGEFVTVGQLNKDEAVLLLFSQRGIAKFKQNFSVTDPEETSFFSREDAICVPGFGPISASPMSSTGMSIQTADGSRGISVDKATAKVLAPGVEISGNTKIQSGITCTFATLSGQVVTVQDGIIVGIA